MLLRRSTSVLAAAALAATSAVAAEEFLAIAMDRDHLLFVTRELSSADLRELTFGQDHRFIQAFKSIDDQGLLALATATFREHPAAQVTVWVDPNARPMNWPAGWNADSDMLDSAAYLQILLQQARDAAGVRDPLPWRMNLMTATFPPPVPLKIGSHTLQEPP